MSEAIDFAPGTKNRVVVHEFTPVDVKAIKSKTGMSQPEFASAFGINLGILPDSSVYVQTGARIMKNGRVALE